MSGFEIISVNSICSGCGFYLLNIPCEKTPQQCVKTARRQDSRFHERSFDEDEEIMGFNFRRGIRENY